MLENTLDVSKNVVSTCQIDTVVLMRSMRQLISEQARSDASLQEFREQVRARAY